MFTLIYLNLNKYLQSKLAHTTAISNKNDLVFMVNLNMSKSVLSRSPTNALMLITER